MLIKISDLLARSRWCLSILRHRYEHVRSSVSGSPPYAVIPRQHSDLVPPTRIVKSPTANPSTSMNLKLWQLSALAPSREVLVPPVYIVSIPLGILCLGLRQMQ